MIRRRARSEERDRAPLLILAAVTTIPLLLTAPGRVVADTKTYLYLDPARLLARAPSMWDPHVGMGTVTHQNIGYLWPMGPYYWLMDRVGVPDWIAQRLWLAAIIFAAGAGVRFLLRVFGWRGVGVTVAACTYALTPYVLTLGARLSVILLPFAGLPWLLALLIRALRRGGWRDPALFALVVATIGSVNATALVLAGLALALWVPFAIWVSKEVTPRKAAGAITRIGVLALAANLWWISGLAVQASHGIDVLRYSETAAIVADTSSAHEILRGLGYWFFYGNDRLDRWVEASDLYTQNIAVLLVSYAIPVLALLGAAVGRWRHRAYFVGLLALGTVVAVGAHPWDSPSAVGRAIKAFLLSERGLAMRSLPRAVPLVALALAVLLGSGAVALARRAPARARALGALLVVIAVLGLPPLWLGRMVPANLDRDEDVPSYWDEAADFLDKTGTGTRALEIPGSEFAAYRWGETVDPILVGLTDRPVVARELIPYGTPPSANLLNALDLGVQEQTLEPGALAPIARLMRVGQIVVRSDLQYERYDTARPRMVWDLVRRAGGLGEPVEFGSTAPNTPSPKVPLLDDLELGTLSGLPHPPAVAVVPVTEAETIISAKPAVAPLVVAGDAHGLVDAAGAGLLSGHELVLYSAALSDEELETAIDEGAALLLTDTNRRRGERWTTIRATRGYTEPAGQRALRRDLLDARLPVFPGAGDDARTVALHRGGITANATSYGDPVGYAPEDRPANAVDGDPATAWRTAGDAPIAGERLVLDLDDPVRTGEVTLLQPATPGANRWITKVELRFDGGDPVSVDLDDASRSGGGQRVTFAPRTFSHVEIEVRSDTAGHRPRYGGLSRAGFAEVRIGSLELDEIIRPPVDLLDRGGREARDRPLTVLLTRLRAAPSDTTRQDEETALVRALTLPQSRSFALAGDVRLSAHVADELVDDLIGVPDAASGGVTASSSSRLAGSIRARASAAIDGEPSTAWTSAFGDQLGQSVSVQTAAPVTVGALHLVVVADGRHSVPTRLRLVVDEMTTTLDVPAIDDGTRPGDTATVELALDAPVTGTSIQVVVDDYRAARTQPWRGPLVTMPVAIAELGIDGLRAPAPAEQIDTGCRDDLLEIDGAPVAVSISGATADAVAGRPLALASCLAAPVALGAGESILRAAPALSSGFDIDQLVLRSGAGGAASAASGPLRDEAASRLSLEPSSGPRAYVVTSESDHARVRVSGAARGEPFWLVLGQSHSDGWEASIGGADLGEPTLVDGFANGWRIDPAAQDLLVDLRFAPQERVDRSLMISALAVLLCLGLVVRRPRPLPAPNADEQPAPLAPFLLLNYEGPLPTRRRAIVTGIALGVGSALVANMLVGVIVGGLSYRALRDDRVRRWIVFGAPAALVLATAYVVVTQLRHGVAPGVEWATELSRVHPLGLLAVLLLVADVVIDRSWQVRGDERRLFRFRHRETDQPSSLPGGRRSRLRSD